MDKGERRVRHVALAALVDTLAILKIHEGEEYWSKPYDVASKLWEALREVGVTRERLPKASKAHSHADTPIPCGDCGDRFGL